jgi:hypothetical protein
MAVIAAALAACEDSRPAPRPAPPTVAEATPAPAPPVKPPDDPRCPCPPGTTQRRFESKVVRGALDLWCEDAEGSRQGMLREFYPNGQLMKETAYRDGLPDGPVRTWYPDGKLESEAAHRGGKLDGLDRRWHPNGKRKAEVRYEADQAVGVGRFWDERGRLVRTRDYGKDPQPTPQSSRLGER